MRTPLSLLAALLLVPAIAPAQSSTSATDNPYLRAQRLVNEGDASAGRKLVDSLFTAARPGSAQHAEALYWRAALAATAAEAERDYRRLTVEYPLSPRAEDALLTLAQLELTRREYPQAIRHLERLVQEHARGSSVPRAHYWLGRVHLEQGNLPRACASLASARAATPRSNVELHNQIDFHSQRCLGVDTSGIIADAAPSQAAPVPPVQAPPASTLPAQTAPTSTQRVQTPAASDVTPPRRDSSVPATRPATSPPSSGAAAATQYTVQVAALNTRAQAEELRDKLRTRGYEARVVGVGQLFRVRIGRYATRGAAAAVAGELRQKGISRDAWVAEAESR